MVKSEETDRRNNKNKNYINCISVQYINMRCEWNRQHSQYFHIKKLTKYTHHHQHHQHHQLYNFNSIPTSCTMSLISTEPEDHQLLILFTSFSTASSINSILCIHPIGSSCPLVSVSIYFMLFQTNTHNQDTNIITVRHPSSSAQHPNISKPVRNMEFISFSFHFYFMFNFFLSYPYNYISGFVAFPPILATAINIPYHPNCTAVST